MAANAAPTSVSEPAWGAYAPGSVQQALLSVTRAAPPSGPARLAGSFARNLMLAGLSRPVDEMAYGARVRFHPKDNLADKRALFFPQLWDTMEREAIRAAFKPKFIFFDVGANSGLYSLFVAANAPSNAVIVAVEPQPGVKDRLLFNIAANGYTNIRHADAALAEKTGTAVLSIEQGNKGASSIATVGPRGGEGVTVSTLSLLELMDFHNIDQVDALKIDIEGAEDRVLPPFFDTAPRRRFPRLIVMETLSKTWRIDCVARALEVGYREVARNPRNVVLEFDPDRPAPLGLAHKGMM